MADREQPSPIPAEAVQAAIDGVDHEYVERCGFDHNAARAALAAAAPVLAAELVENEGVMKALRRHRDTAEAAIARVRQEHAAIHAAMDAFAATHEPACECEVIPATRETADRMLAALDALPERTKNA